MSPRQHVTLADFLSRCDESSSFFTKLIRRHAYLLMGSHEQAINLLNGFCAQGLGCELAKVSLVALVWSSVHDERDAPS